MSNTELEKVNCCQCGKLLEFDEEDWWGPLVLCKKVCGKQMMEEYKEHVRRKQQDDSTES